MGGALAYVKTGAGAGKLGWKTSTGALIYKKPFEEDLTGPTRFLRVGERGAFDGDLENREYSRSELQTLGLDAFAADAWGSTSLTDSQCFWFNQYVNVGDPDFNYWENYVLLYVVCCRYDTSAYSGKTITECDVTVGSLNASGKTMRVGAIASSSSNPGTADDWHEGGITQEVTANGTVTISGSLTLDDYLYVVRYCVGLQLPDSMGLNKIDANGDTVTIRE